jgi:hypothetical protein
VSPVDRHDVTRALVAAREALADVTTHRDSHDRQLNSILASQKRVRLIKRVAIAIRHRRSRRSRCSRHVQSKHVSTNGWRLFHSCGELGTVTRLATSNENTTATTTTPTTLLTSFLGIDGTMIAPCVETLIDLGPPSFVRSLDARAGAPSAG